MPTYEYECTKCNHTFEEEAPMSAPPRQRCPRCRGKVRRLISGGMGIVFKGSGFYVNDSRSQAAGPAKSGSATPELNKTDAAAGDKPASPPAANDSKTAAPDKPQ